MKNVSNDNILNISNLKEIFNQEEIHRIIILKKLIRNWNDLVGPVVAEHSYPKQINANVLIIETSHSAYSQEILFQSQKILDFIHKQSSLKNIKSIRCNIGNIPIRNKKKGITRKPSLEGKDSLIQSLEKIKDEDLKKKLLSIIEVME